MKMTAKLRSLPVCVAAITALGLGASTLAWGETTLTVALAANPQMQTAAKLIGNFEKKYS